MMQHCICEQAGLDSPGFQRQSMARASVNKQLTLRAAGADAPRLLNHKGPVHSHLLAHRRIGRLLKGVRAEESTCERSIHKWTPWCRPH